jgi:hypothetical protein
MNRFERDFLDDFIRINQIIHSISMI